MIFFYITQRAQFSSHKIVIKVGFSSLKTTKLQCCMIAIECCFTKNILKAFAFFLLYIVFIICRCNQRTLATLLNCWHIHETKKRKKNATCRKNVVSNTRGKFFFHSRSKFELEWKKEPLSSLVWQVTILNVL
jgi:hypothetical protein